jgi:hypothetical protein
MTREELAAKCIVELVKHVFAHQGRTLNGLTYEKLSCSIGFLNKHGEPQPRLGKILGKMGRNLESIEAAFPEGIPHIQALVVMKNGRNRGVPDDGIKEFWDGYDQLSLNEKKNKAFAEWQTIAAFGSRWNTVLQQLGLSAGVAPDLSPAPIPAQARGRGGESPAHKALKAHIKANPQLVGVEGGAKVFEEYALPSLDTLDVLFKTRTCWTAIEVKSAISDDVLGDYERGIYQIVKYTALLQAMRRDPKYEAPETHRVILVLEHSLPTALTALKETLGVTVIDCVTPPTTTQPHL